MMPKTYDVDCPHCQCQLTITEEEHRNGVECPDCGMIIVVQGVARAPAKLPPPPPAKLPPPLPRVFLRPTGASARPPRPPAGNFDEISDVIPETHRHLLLKGEKAFHFEWIDDTGGCGSTQSAEQFILITDQRVLYEAKIREAERLIYVRTSGSIPLAKISYVGTSSTTTAGCNPQQAHVLKVNSGGGHIGFAFISEKKAKRVQRVIEELASTR